MTDIDRLKELLDLWNVPHKPSKYFDEVGHELKVGGYTHQNDPRNTVRGYNGMYTLFVFDGEGKFVAMGAWE